MRRTNTKIVPMVKNLLPEFTSSNWEFDRQELINDNYSASHYAGESIIPEGNIMVLYPSGSYSECYSSPIESKWPRLTVGHTYYLRWLSRKERTESGDQGTANIDEDVYWPEVPNPILQGVNSSHYTRFRKNSYIFTLQQSQWPDTTVVDGPQKIRFDCNNRRKYVHYFVLADFMLIDLTATYAERGLEIPTLSDLTSRPYFSGRIELADWHN
ncbi:MAG: hypothetical protein IKI48_01765 [Prevotella sp.]|nr:hypothetical protein [Bacteroidales bacterium]MBR6904937.1 hypothetical protein [Bacteroidales bacterium]MBR7093511.1 hypothetical protein [Prevotella sp.]